MSSTRYVKSVVATHQSVTWIRSCFDAIYWLARSRIYVFYTTVMNFTCTDCCLITTSQLFSFYPHRSGSVDH